MEVTSGIFLLILALVLSELKCEKVIDKKVGKPVMQERQNLLQSSMEFANNLKRTRFVIHNKMLNEEWLSRIDESYQMIGVLNGDDTKREALLFDLLQDMYSNNLREDVKMEMVIFLEQQMDIMIQTASSAEYVAGTLLNVYTDEKSNVLLQSQLVVTLTVICTSYDIKDVNSQLFAEFVTLLLETINKVHAGNHPLLIKTCCESLEVIQHTHPGTGQEYVADILECAKKERMFISSNYSILLAEIIQENESNKEKDINKEKLLDKVFSYLMNSASQMSPTGLLRMLPKIVPVLGKRKIATSVFGSLYSSFSQSHHLLICWLAIYLQKNVLHKVENTSLIINCVNLITLLPICEAALLLKWLFSYTQSLEGDRKIITCELIASQVQPNAYIKFNKYFQLRMGGFATFIADIRLDLSRGSRAELLQVLFTRSPFVESEREREALFHGLFSLYKSPDCEMRLRVVQFIKEYAIYTLEAVTNAIYFAQSIKTFDYEACCSLMKELTERLLEFDEERILESTEFYFMHMERVSLMKEICPLAIMEKVGALKSLFESCKWDIGNSVLSICANILITHKQSYIINEMATLLWEMSKTFTSVELRERALFYYTIIGNVSPDQFGEILISTTDVKQIEQKRNNFKGHSTVVSTGIPFIERIPNQFLSLKISNDDDETLLNLNKLTLDDITTFEGYKDLLSQSGFSRNIFHKFILKFKEDVEPINDVYAIEVQFSTESNFKPVKSVCCPYLSKDFKKEEEMVVSFTPITPLPTTFTTQATYIDGENRTLNVLLDAFQLQFRHLILPLPVVNIKDGSSLFELLWKEIECNQVSRNNPNSRNICSVKYMHDLSSLFLKLELEQYIISENENCLHVGWHLPSRCHVLLKFRFQDACIVDIATDEYTLLDRVDCYLLKLMQR